MELLGDVSHVEPHFFPYGGSVSVGARLVHYWRQTYHRLRKSFWKQLMVLLRDEGQVKAHFGPFGDSANLDGHRCTICVERTICMEIISDAPYGSSR